MIAEPGMSDAVSSEMHTRREFVRFGAFSVAAASFPLGISMVPSISGEAGAATRKVFDIKVLVPESGMFPTLGSSLLAGIKMYFDAADTPVKVRVLKRSFRSGERAAMEAAGKSVGEGAKLIVSFLSPEVADAVRQEIPDVTVINLHAGANVPREGIDVLENTLSYWQSSYAAGRWAAGNIGMRAVEVMSCYDSGFDAPCAFRAGFEKAGGEISGSFVTHLPSEPAPKLDVALGGVKDANPDFVYASYFGNPASDFLKAYSASGLGKNIPLVGSSFLTDEETVAAAGNAAPGVVGFGTWSSGSSAKVSRKFVSGYVAKHGKVPDSVAMLGYETAGIIGAALKSTSGKTSGKTSTMREALQRVSFVGPRGEARLGVGGYVHAREVRKTNGRYVNVPVGGAREKVAGAGQVPGVVEGPKTGWLNNYLVM